MHNQLSPPLLPLPGSEATPHKNHLEAVLRNLTRVWFQFQHLQELGHEEVMNLL